MADIDPIRKFEVTRLHQGSLDLWDKLVERSPHGTIFHSSWWLQATGFECEILVVKDRQGNLVGGMPLPRKSRVGLRLLHPPPLTPCLGPIFDIDIAGLNRSYKKLSLMRHAGEALARAISGFDTLSYWTGPSAPDLQGFLWAGFNVQVGYTLKFEAEAGPEKILAGMTDTHRNMLQKAARSDIRCETTDDVDSLLRFHQMTFQQQGLSLPYSLGWAETLIKAALQRGQGRIYVARSAEKIVAASLMVWDSRSAYQLITGGDPDLRASGAGTLLEWRAIQDSLAAGRAFDFEGSHLRGVEQHYRHFGAEPRTIFHISKAGTVLGAGARLLWPWISRRR